MSAGRNVFDVAVVGTGFGGAVAACRLAQSGLRVLMLERGLCWGPRLAHHEGHNSRQFARSLVSLPQVVRDETWNPQGLYELRRFGSLLVLTTCGLGGGSLVYSNLLVPPPAHYWSGHPLHERRAELAGKVRSVLRPEVDPEDPEGVPQGVVWHKATTNAAGLHQGPCVRCGACLLGCRYSSKTTMDQSYIPLALSAGATLWTSAEVVALGSSGAGYTVRIRRRREDKTEHLQLSVPQVVLAAGTLGTLALLLRARDSHKSLRLPPSLGSGFSANGDAGALRMDDDLSSLFRRVSGGPAVLSTTQREDGLVGKLRLPVPGLHAWFGMKKEGRASQVRLRKGEVWVDYQGSRADERLAGALRDKVPFGPKSQWVASVHPLGGVPTGSDGVIDERGEVNGHPGLWIADGSALCRPLGLPPAFSIALWSEWVAESITAP